jgi:hypothetical protein
MNLRGPEVSNVAELAFTAKDIAFVEWNSEGRVSRIIRGCMLDHSHLNTLDHIINTIDYPHQLEEWDVNWCKRDECYYVNYVGGWSGRVYLYKMMEGRRVKFWAADRVQFTDATLGQDEITAEEITALGYDRVAPTPIPRDLTRVCEETHSDWCEICQDMLPSNDHCEHFYWCDDCGCLSEKTDKCEHYCEEHEETFHYCGWLHECLPE